MMSRDIETPRRLLFSPGFPPTIGGAENFMFSRCIAAPENLEVVAAHSPGSTAFDIQQRFPIHRFHYPWYQPAYEPLRRVLQIQRSAEILNRLLRQRNYCVIETVTVFPGAIVAQMLRKMYRRRMYLISFALGDDVLRPQQRWYASRLFQSSLQAVDRFIAISHSTRDILLSLGVHPERVAIIHPPIDIVRFSRYGEPWRIKLKLPPHDHMLLTICRLVGKKNIESVIRLMPRLRERFPGLIYVIGGEGEDEPRLRHIACECGIAEHVIFLGRIDQDALVDTYAAGDIFVMPTKLDRSKGEMEGFGIAFLEAASQGVPSIASRYGGGADAVVESLTGYLVDPDDPAELERRIGELLSNPALRRQLGTAGRSRALQPTDWSPLLSLIYR